jgi:hypothetical protein
MSIFIEGRNVKEHFILVVNNTFFYKFNGKYAVYPINIAIEKKEEKSTDKDHMTIKRVWGVTNSPCEECHSPIEDIPVMKVNDVLSTICPSCHRVTKVLSMRGFNKYTNELIVPDTIEVEDIKNSEREDD